MKINYILTISAIPPLEDSRFLPTLPTLPAVFATPLGKLLSFEFSNNLEDSTACATNLKSSGFNL